jgi:hypothetical protein
MEYTRTHRRNAMRRWWMDRATGGMGMTVQNGNRIAALP